MPDSLILLAPTVSPPARPFSLPSGHTLRLPTPADTPALAALYFEAYDPGIACDTLAEAIEDIRATFAGAYGDLLPAASALIVLDEPSGPNGVPRAAAGRDSGPSEPATLAAPGDPPTSTLAAAILTVHRAPWEGTPDCPFIVELFTDPAHRRRGLARHVLTHALAAAHAAGEGAVALRVAADNAPALALYHSLRFKPWHPPIS